MENIDLDDHVHNILVQEDEIFENYEFKHNFINIPWDDRTTQSKVGIVMLLAGIFVATMAGVVGNFIVQYRYPMKPELVGFSYNLNNTPNCQALKGEDYSYIAKIYSVVSHELLCVGAVVNEYTVLANGACIKTGRVRLQVGNLSDNRCKNGFSVNNVKSIAHEGVVSKNLVLLRTFENMSECATSIEIGSVLDWTKRAFVVGRSVIDWRSFSRQPVIVPKTEKVTSQRALSNVICVQMILNCPVLVGDLLIQDQRLYGIASTSSYNKEHLHDVCFADLKNFEQELTDFGIYFSF